MSAIRVGIDARPIKVGRGGVSRYTEALAQSIARVAPDSEIVLYGHRVDGFGLEADNVRWSQIEFPAKILLDQLFMVGAKSEIDVFHGTNYVVPLWGSFPKVVTIHDMSVRLYPETHPALRRLSHCLLPARCRSATRVLVDSDSTRDDVIRVLAGC